MTSLWGNPSQINANASGTLLRETLVNTSAGQTVFNITKFTYTPATSTLQVYLNGQLQLVGVDYVESSSTSITFNTGINLTDVVDVIGFPLANLTVPSPANLVGASDGGLGFWTTVQGFINKIISSTGASVIGFIQSGVGAILVSIQAKLRKFADVDEFGADYTAVSDSTAAINNALLAHKCVQISGPVKILGKINLQSGQRLKILAGASIRQYTANTQILEAAQRDDCWVIFEGGVLYGEGSWSAGWTGNSGHFDKGLSFLGCTRSGIIRPRIKNCASDGIYIAGGERITVTNPIIEGTNLYSTPLPAGSNFQNGVHIVDDAVYGIGKSINIPNADISGTAQGVLRENYGTASLVTSTVNMPGAIIHDITGQHAFYIQGGQFSAEGAILNNIEGSGFKVQSADANQNIKGYKFSGNAYNVRGNLLELATIGTGSLQDVVFDVVADNCGTCCTVNGAVSDVIGRITASNSTAYLAYIFGVGPSGIDLTINGTNVGQDGVLITATNSDIKLRPRIRNPNTLLLNAAYSGIRVQSASATVDIYDPDITDANNKMGYGLFNAIVGSVVRVHGSVKITGATDTAVRATGTITEWPTDAILQGTNGAFLSTATVSSAHTMVFDATSTSATNVTLWQQTLDDLSAYQVAIELVGKLSTSAERAIYKETICVYRNGGIATVQGAVVSNVSIVSVGFAGVHTFGVNGFNEVVVQVNSGGVATYKWRVRVTVTKVV